MKKFLLPLCVLSCLLILGIWKFISPYISRNLFIADDTIYINVLNDNSYLEANLLKEKLEQEGKKVVLSYTGAFKSGNYNIYTADTINKLPTVIDKNAINFLWINKMTGDENPELLRPFDVIVTQNFPAFSHLKAINVRTAFIPQAINIAKYKETSLKNVAMFWGDGNSFSPALWLAGKDKISLDVYGENFEGRWPIKEIIRNEVHLDDFKNYPLVLIDQDNEDVQSEYISEKIITILENNGLPFIRYNPAIEKLFGETIPMYYSDKDFKSKLEYLLSNPDEITERLKALYDISLSWSSHGQAKKFIELFDVMQKKRI